MLLTVLIPTHTNRHQFLYRILSYLSVSNCFYPIIVIDSSSPELIKINQDTIKQISLKIRPKHMILDTNLNLYEKMTIASDYIETPYSVIIADDDFIVPSSLNLGINFLESNPEYSIVHGYAACIETPENKVFGEVINSNFYSQRSLEINDTKKRLQNHMRDYATTFYSIHKTFHLKSNFKKLSECKWLDFRFGELLPSCLSVIQGKTKKMNCLYMIRQSNRYNLRPNKRKKFKDWIADPDWSLNYKHFRYTLAYEIAKKEGIQFEQAKNVVKDAFFSYLVNITQKAKSVDRCEGNEDLILETLLKPESRFHKDFMPIYNTITNTEK